MKYPNTKLILIILIFQVGLTLQAQDTQIRGFVNVDFTATDNSSSFTLGQYDNFITSQITDRISFLGEVVFEFDQDWILDVERVILKYEVDNYLNIKLGKIHTPIGYWNNAYHHGALLQPTISRPLLVKFEDEGGILPIHSTGLWISGRDIGAMSFGYDFTTGNGIGPNNPVADDNNNKSYSFGAHFKPIEYLELGVSTYFDKLEAGELALNGSPLAEALDNSMLVGHLAYTSLGFEAIGEYHSITNKTSSVDATTNAYFIYAGYNLEKITPYIRYDNIKYDNSEPYYELNDKTMFTVGLRYNMSHLANLKIQYSNLDSELDGKVNSVTLSYAVGF